MLYVRGYAKARTGSGAAGVVQAMPRSRCALALTITMRRLARDDSRCTSCEGALCIIARERERVNPIFSTVLSPNSKRLVIAQLLPRSQLGFRWNSNGDPLSSSLLLVVCARCATSRLLCTGDAWTRKVL